MVQYGIVHCIEKFTTNSPEAKQKPSQDVVRHTSAREELGFKTELEWDTGKNSERQDLTKIMKKIELGEEQKQIAIRTLDCNAWRLEFCEGVNLKEK